MTILFTDDVDLHPVDDQCADVQWLTDNDKIISTAESSD